MQRFLIVVLSALVLASCAQGPTGPGGTAASDYEPPSAAGNTFEVRDFAWSTAKGDSSISGALTYHQGAARFSCQGSDVLLTPETPWSRRRMIVLYGSASVAAAPVSIVRARTPSAGAGDYARFVRRTTCDSASHFSFNGLPNGSWFVITVGKSIEGAGEPVAVTRRVETHGGPVNMSLP
jgi:hypothetical protein